MHALTGASLCELCIPVAARSATSVPLWSAIVTSSQGIVIEAKGSLKTTLRVITNNSAPVPTVTSLRLSASRAACSCNFWCARVPTNGAADIIWGNGGSRSVEAWAVARVNPLVGGNCFGQSEIKKDHLLGDLPPDLNPHLIEAERKRS